MRRGFEIVGRRLVGFYQSFGVGGKKFRFDPGSAKERTRALKLATTREREIREREEERRRNRRRSKGR